MNMHQISKEIGWFETALNLSKVRESEDVVSKVGDSMPLPDENIDIRIKTISKWLLEFDKQKYMFLTPEIALIEEMGRISDTYSDSHKEAIIAIPHNLEEDAKERLKNNLPHGISVTLVEESFFPVLFPSNGLLVICGYSGGGRAMIHEDTYRMVDHYSGFLGKKAFVPYVDLEAAVRYDGWREMNQQKFNLMWEGES